MCYSTKIILVYFVFQGVSVSVSVLTLSVISIERWYAICHPLAFKSTITRARVMIILIWLVALGKSNMSFFDHRRGISLVDMGPQ